MVSGIVPCGALVGDLSRGSMSGRLSYCVDNGQQALPSLLAIACLYGPNYASITMLVLPLKGLQGRHPVRGWYAAS